MQLYLASQFTPLSKRMTSNELHHHMYKTCHKVMIRPSQRDLSLTKSACERESERQREISYLNEEGLEGHSGT
jgi:hypothetical protein